jgi:hypothetical protein
VSRICPDGTPASASAPPAADDILHVGVADLIEDAAEDAAMLADRVAPER